MEAETPTNQEAAKRVKHLCKKWEGTQLGERLSALRDQLHKIYVDVLLKNSRPKTDRIDLMCVFTVINKHWPYDEKAIEQAKYYCSIHNISTAVIYTVRILESMRTCFMEITKLPTVDSNTGTSGAEAGAGAGAGADPDM